MSEPSLVPMERIERAILVLRGHRVMLDADLAALYQVETKALVRAVTRNIERFPADFMFRLSADEFENLRRQFGTSSSWGGRRHLPYAFTEQGVAMLSSVLGSARAVQVNITIVRAFVRLRQMLQTNAELAKKLAALEQKYDAQFRVVFDAIRELMAPPGTPKTRIGFRGEDR
ncbi:MAG: DNA-binding protein [Acidobacteria bacterium RIFCSPLOWO2_12_FULL_65_11]|nr:MAG: DNA-binding protein [Acidobacteria bacterium RIFCSPLOWO2_02_FULL_64_15]OFW34486.1 MAG: DNA-binding protein [Acidobacteria bacterium RIFCSPLOWO2_12_FULL_65_11]